MDTITNNPTPNPAVIVIDDDTDTSIRMDKLISLEDIQRIYQQYLTFTTPSSPPPFPPPTLPTSFRDAWSPNYVRLPCSKGNTYTPDPVLDPEGKARRWDFIHRVFSRRITTSQDLANSIIAANRPESDSWDLSGLVAFLDTLPSGRQSSSSTPSSPNEQPRKKVKLTDFFSQTTPSSSSTNGTSTTAESSQPPPPSSTTSEPSINNYLTQRHFFDTLLPYIIRLAFLLPHVIPSPIPLLPQRESKSITLNTLQIASLLANTFLSTYPDRSRSSNYPSINLIGLYYGHNNNTIYPQNAAKIQGILHFFERKRRITDLTEFQHCVVYERICVRKLPDWINNDTELDLRVLPQSEGTIEDYPHPSGHVDFANKIVGGGVLRKGCVQEEIRFIINPDLIIARLFTETLTEHECLTVYGTERLTAYTGYSRSFLWKSDYIDHNRFNRSHPLLRQTELIAIDALHFDRIQTHKQFAIDLILRELNKSYAGFKGSTYSLPILVTGNWGCGAFHGDKVLKFIIQWLSFSVSKRQQLVYYTFGEGWLVELMGRWVEVAGEKKVTVGMVVKALEEYAGVCRVMALTEYLDSTVFAKKK